MISRAQQILLKRAQAQARIEDEEYRQTLELVTGLPGCRSSKDPRLTDRHLDNLLAYIEAIYWRRVHATELVHERDPKAVFQWPGYWAKKNTKEETSRDRYTAEHIDQDIHTTEQDLMANHNCSLQYIAAIQNRINPFDKYTYHAALKRTLEAKRRKPAIKNPAGIQSGELL